MQMCLMQHQRTQHAPEVVLKDILLHKQLPQPEPRVLSEGCAPMRLNPARPDGVGGARTLLPVLAAPTLPQQRGNGFSLSTLFC